MTHKAPKSFVINVYRGFSNIQCYYGYADVVLAIGFKKIKVGSLESVENIDGRRDALEWHVDVISSTRGLALVPLMAQMFANVGREHMNKC
ncbi:hypothetical protein LOAG_12152, partial [Loa loa]